MSPGEFDLLVKDVKAHPKAEKKRLPREARSRGRTPVPAGPARQGAAPDILLQGLHLPGRDSHGVWDRPGIRITPHGADRAHSQKVHPGPCQDTQTGREALHA